MKYSTSSFSSASSFSSPPRAVRWGCFVVLVLAVVTSWRPSSSSTPQLGSIMLGGVAATNRDEEGCLAQPAPRPRRPDARRAGPSQQSGPSSRSDRHKPYDDQRDGFTCYVVVILVLLVLYDL